MKAPDLLGQLQDFVKHPGWVMISRILDAQAQTRTNAIVCQPLNGLDATLEQEYMKGEAAQLLTLRGLPEVLIEELQEAVKDMQADAPRSDDSGDTSGDSD
jgi:hypothetical protein